ncbi:hypothetical protein BC628DRAFT_149043 [Trametes gibbosa]|nr:hypothetical protein BC628DRAFT_149043 [Trametes gibbosa]
MHAPHRLLAADARPHLFRVSTLRRVAQNVHTRARNTESPSPLPPTFRSFYRLFLRATSASVLAHPQATSRLRHLWRPIFDDAARAVRQVESDSLSTDQRAAVMRWYTQWEDRMDNTISLLCSSATSRGLPHRITHNLQQMALVNCTVRDPLRPPKRSWRGQLPPNSTEYQRKPKKPQTPTQTELYALFRTTPRLLGEIVGMAESWGRLSLGRTCRRH